MCICGSFSLRRSSGSKDERVQIGFSAIQMALHHPTGLAEQISLLDNLSRGRIILGIGRGTAFNFYEYRAYGVPFEEAQKRLIESELILISAWTNTSTFSHQGRHFQLEMSPLRPRVFSKPHPPVIRALATKKQCWKWRGRDAPLC